MVKKCEYCNKRLKVYLIRKRKYCSYKCKCKKNREKRNAKILRNYYRNRDAQKARCLNYYYKNRKNVLAYQIARIEEKRKHYPFKKKYDARHKSAKLISLKDKKCQFRGCEETKDLQRHHDDYDDSKNVKIFCRKHHQIYHETHRELDGVY